MSRDTARRRLDERLAPLRQLDVPRPPRGWARAIRDALGMSTRELAARLGLSEATVRSVERNEVDDVVQLGTLRRVADAMECDLVYFLVPRTSLEATVQQQAERAARSQIASVVHSMRLEDQAPTDAEVDRLVAEVAAERLQRRGLWAKQ